MKLREEIGYQIWNGEHPGSMGADLLKLKVDNIMEKVKEWALEMVGEDWEEDSKDADVQKAIKQTIRKRIEESIK